jgi:threonyl-tRNA synthetase
MRSAANGVTGAHGFGSSQRESVRTRGKGDQGSMPLADFIAKATALVEMQSTEL